MFVGYAIGGGRDSPFRKRSREGGTNHNQTQHFFRDWAERGGNLWSDRLTIFRDEDASGRDGGGGRRRLIQLQLHPELELLLLLTLLLELELLENRGGCCAGGLTVAQAAANLRCWQWLLLELLAVGGVKVGRRRWRRRMVHEMVGGGGGGPTVPASVGGRGLDNSTPSMIW